MTRKTNQLNIDNCVSLLNSGAKPAEVVAKTGVSRSVVYRLARKIGISLEVAPLYLSLPAKGVIHMYHCGIGSAGIARKLGTSASVINQLLVANGITPRDRGQQQQARMDNSSLEVRKSLTLKANAAATGRKKTADEIIKSAESRFIAQSSRSSHLEEIFDVLMRERGREGIRQLNINKYNADFVFGNVAVEIFGGCWHWTGKHLARSGERIKSILDAGFHLVILAARDGQITSQATDKIVALIDEFSRDESEFRHYRMICSNGQDAISQRSDSDHFTIEWPFRNVVNPANGQYTRAT